MCLSHNTITKINILVAKYIKRYAFVYIGELRFRNEKKKKQKQKEKKRKLTIIIESLNRRVRVLNIL